MSRHSSRTNSYRIKAAKLRALGLPCWLCHKAIRYDVHWRHPASFSVDHIIEKRHGGTDHEDNLRPAHRLCNIRRTRRYSGPPVQLELLSVQPRHSREW